MKIKDEPDVMISRNEVIGIIEKIYFRWDCYEKDPIREEAACSALSEAMNKISNMAE